MARAAEVDEREIAQDVAARSAAGPDLDVLTDALYEQIEQRLRTDLLLERERLGCLTDL